MTQIKIKYDKHTRIEGDRINQEKKHFAREITQPFNDDGTVNREFIRYYGPEAYKERFGKSVDDLIQERGIR